jgi:hypothetical protein
MASTYSNSLKLELIGNGDQSGTWGTTTNNNLGTLLEQAITGVQSIVMSNANYTLTNYNGVSDEARNAVLVVTGTNSATRQIICPLVNKIYIVTNNTTAGTYGAITIGGATGSTVSIPNGVTAQVYCDGTNFYSAQTGSAGSFVVNGTLTATGVTDTGPLTATTIGGTTITASSQFSGPGTGLTGTASGLTVGTATNATNATNLTTSNFTITESGGKLLIKYGATTIASIDSSGNIISAANVTAYGTP